jgi:hypothetical protein
MSQKFNENLYPDGGWYFRDAEGVKHTGSSFRSLVKTVADYRTRNKFEPGEPEVEITVQLCGRNPGYCRDDQPRVPKATEQKPRSTVGTLAQKVISWMTWMTQQRRLKKLQKVSRVEAKRRANICSRCPKQAAFPLSCGACKASVKALERALLGEDPVHDSIETCSVLREQTSTSVFFEFPPSTNPDLPANCWRRPQ